jgi:hypothetical protein
MTILCEFLMKYEQFVNPISFGQTMTSGLPHTYWHMLKLYILW